MVFAASTLEVIFSGMFLVKSLCASGMGSSVD
jgi:hypothetical protein